MATFAVYSKVDGSVLKYIQAPSELWAFKQYAIGIYGIKRVKKMVNENEISFKKDGSAAGL